MACRHIGPSRLQQINDIGSFWVCLREMAEVFNVVAITRGNVVWYIRTYTDYMRARLKLAKLNDEHYDNPEHATFAILVERQ